MIKGEEECSRVPSFSLRISSCVAEASILRIFATVVKEPAYIPETNSSPFSMVKGGSGKAQDLQPLKFLSLLVAIYDNKSITSRLLSLSYANPRDHLLTRTAISLP